MSILIAAVVAAVQVASADCGMLKTQQDLNTCAAKEYAAADVELVQLWNSLPETQRIVASGAQAAWQRYRDEQCNAEGENFSGGQAEPMIVDSCRSRLTRVRIAEIKAQFDIEPEFSGKFILGDQHVMTALEAKREINIVLPLGYDDNPEQRYPVVYMLDGGIAQDLMMQVGIARWVQLYGRSEAFILVGIETKDRQRELLPPTSDEEALQYYPKAGESAAFRDFIRDELKPMIEGAYRVDGRDYLLGESAAGHFVVETLLVEPDLFDGYAAISPSLWWEDQVAPKMAEAAPTSDHPPLFISIADEGESLAEMDEGVRRVVASRTGKTCFLDRPDLTHGVSYHALLPSAFQYLLPGPEPLPEEWGMVTGCKE